VSPTNQDPSTRQRKQLPGKEPQVGRRQRQPRSRECLLKGCGKIFRPRHAKARYCNEECRGKARQWSQWKSRQRWRGSEKGRKKRRQQSLRHRERWRMTGQVSSGRKGVARGSSQSAAYKFFLASRATVQVAMNVSNQPGGRPCNDSARMNAGAR
jgi:hypothetical protein